MNYYKYLSKDMFSDYSEVNLGSKNNSLLLVNLLFYADELKSSYKFIQSNIEFDMSVFAENTKDIYDLFSKVIGENYSYEEYIRQVLNSIFYIELDFKSYKNFSKQLVEILNVLHKEETSFTNFLSHSPENPEISKKFSSSIMKSILLLIRKNVKLTNRRKFQRKIVELFFLKFDFNLEILNGESRRDKIYQTLLLIDFFENDNNFNNDHVIRAIEYSNSAYFNEDKEVNFIIDFKNYFIKHYIQAKLLIKIDFNNIDYFILTNIIYFLTPKFINYFSNLFDEKEIEIFNKSRFKYMKEIKTFDFMLYRTESIDVSNTLEGIQLLLDFGLHIDKDEIIDLVQNITKATKELSMFYLDNDSFNFFTKEKTNFYFEYANKLIKYYNAMKTIEISVLSEVEIPFTGAPYLRRIPLEADEDIDLDELMYGFNDEGFMIGYYLDEYIITPLTYIIYKHAFFIDLHYPLDQVLLEHDLEVIHNKILVGEAIDRYQNYHDEKKKLTDKIELGINSINRVNNFNDDIFGESKDRLRTHYKQEMQIINKNISEMKKAELELKQLEHYNKTKPVNINLDVDHNKIDILTKFDFKEAKSRVVNSLFYDISDSFYYSKYANLSINDISERLNELNQNKYYDWLYTLSLSKYLLDYYEINIYYHFDNDSNVDWTFIYVLLTKSLENLIANFIEYKLTEKNDKFQYSYIKFGQRHVLDLRNPRWREGLSIGDLRFILEDLLTNEVEGILDLSLRIKSLLQQDRNKYLHHNTLKGFNNLKNIYFARIFELVYLLISKV